MNRMLVAATLTAIVTVAAPAFAKSDQPASDRGAGQDQVTASAGAPVPMFAAQAVVPAKGAAVSGIVVISTPAELVVHTAKGLQTFKITPKTEMTAGPFEGEDVTVVFQPAHGSVSGTGAGSAAVTRASTTKVAALALAVMPRMAGVADR